MNIISENPAWHQLTSQKVSEFLGVRGNSRDAYQTRQDVGLGTRPWNPLALYHHGFQVGKYISLERIIEQSKETYYESLNKSSQSWFKAKHNVFPWFNYFLGTVLGAYKEFEERAGTVNPPRGAKTGIVEAAINKQLGEFSISDIEHDCPSVSRVMIKKVLLHMQTNEKIKCLGLGQSAKWTLLR